MKTLVIGGWLDGHWVRHQLRYFQHSIGRGCPSQIYVREPFLVGALKTAFYRLNSMTIKKMFEHLPKYYNPPPK